MATPRVFVSSTCYDLKYIRENIKYFIKQLGYDPVLSEEGNIFFDPSLSTQDSCLVEVPNCQMFVLIIGGRFGSKFKSKSHSITNEEYREAVSKKIPIFALVEQAVYNDSQVYFYNKESTDIDHRSIKYPSVDNVLIFEFIEEVHSNTANNAIMPFKDFSDIESYLLQQWAGMMYSFLSRDNENARVADTLQVLTEMSERVEILSRQILRSVGTEEAKLTAELYETMLYSFLARRLALQKYKPTPIAIIEHKNFHDLMASFGLNIKIDKRKKVIKFATASSMSQATYDYFEKKFLELKELLLKILNKYNITPEKYIESLKNSK